MSFDPLETSRCLGEPVGLFYFKYGEDDGAFYAYADSEETLTFSGIVYSPLPLDRSAVTASGTLDKAMLTISVPRDAEVANLFKVSAPAYGVSLTIRQGHIGDENQDFNVIWAGRVVSCAFEGSEAKLSCEPVNTAMKRKGLRRCYQYGCPHALYGEHCRANETIATRDGVVVSIEGSRVTLAAGWNGAFDVEKYIGGRFQWLRASGKEIRTILKLVDPVTVYLSGTPLGLATGNEVKIALGCDHSMEDCEVVHNNVQNFGGQPWIPLNSPIHINPYH